VPELAGLLGDVMIETIIETPAEIAAGGCSVQMIRGAWPKPLERHVWKGDRTIVATLLRSPPYRAEAHYAGTAGTYERIGNVFLVPPDCELIGRSTGGKYRAIRCVFEPDDDRELLDTMRSLNAVQLGKCLDIGTATITSLMNRLLQEIVAPGFAAEALVDSLGSALLIESVRLLRGATVLPDRSGKRGLQPRHLRLIDDYLDGLETGSPRISEIARLCGFNAHYFCKLFRLRTGQSLGRYLTDSRIRRAERLLAETELPLKEIAFRLGFANAANFSTAFRTERRQAPSAYRNQMRPSLVSFEPSKPRPLR
jgi:AraC family transcriptional regulator